MTNSNFWKVHSKKLSYTTAWRITWTKEPGGLKSIGLQSWTWLKWLSACMCACARAHTHTHTHTRFFNWILVRILANEIPLCYCYLIISKHTHKTWQHTRTVNSFFYLLNKYSLGTWWYYNKIKNLLFWNLHSDGVRSWGNKHTL